MTYFVIYDKDADGFIGELDDRIVSNCFIATTYNKRHNREAVIDMSPNLLIFPCKEIAEAYRKRLCNQVNMEIKSYFFVFSDIFEEVKQKSALNIFRYFYKSDENQKEKEN